MPQPNYQDLIFKRPDTGKYYSITNGIAREFDAAGQQQAAQLNPNAQNQDWGVGTSGYDPEHGGGKTGATWSFDNFKNTADTYAAQNDPNVQVSVYDPSKDASHGSLIQVPTVQQTGFGGSNQPTAQNNPLDPYNTGRTYSSAQKDGGYYVYGQDNGIKWYDPANPNAAPAPRNASGTPSAPTAPVAPAAPTNQPGTVSQNGSYTVQRGDTLSALAKKYGVTTQDLLKLNPHLSNPNLIQSGASLNVPGKKQVLDPKTPLGSLFPASGNQEPAPPAAPPAPQPNIQTDPNDELIKQAMQRLLNPQVDPQTAELKQKYLDLKTKMGSLDTQLRGLPADVQKQVQDYAVNASQLARISGAAAKPLADLYDQESKLLDQYNTSIGLSEKQAEKSQQSLLDYFNLLKLQSDIKKGNAPEKVGQGDSLVDPTTGKVIYSAPTELKHSPAYLEYQDAINSGYKGSFNDYQTLDSNRKRSISTTNNITQDGKELNNLLKQLQIENLMGGTPAQQLNSNYASRIEQSNKIIEQIQPKIVSQGVLGQMIQKTTPNFAKSDITQSQEQAERNFLSAVLRRESGAVISPSEFSEGAKQYFPRPGDSASVLKQKQANRDLVQRNFISSSGRAYQAPADTTAKVDPLGIR